MSKTDVQNYVSKFMSKRDVHKLSSKVMFKSNVQKLDLMTFKSGIQKWRLKVIPVKMRGYP